MTHLEQIRFDFAKSQFQNELKSLRMEYATEDWDAEYWIEAMAQYDTRIKWCKAGRLADGKVAKSIVFRNVFKIRTVHWSKNRRVGRANLSLSQAKYFFDSTFSESIFEQF